VYYSLGISVMPASSLWLLSRPLWEPGSTLIQSIAGLALCTAVFYQCSIGWLALRYIQTRIVAFADRLLIQSNGVEQHVSWEDLAPAKEYPFATVTRLSRKDGRTILYALDEMTDLCVIKSVMNTEAEEIVPGDK
jgi:hypothetical protein